MFSKTIFLQYLQCPKLAWISYNIPKKLNPPKSSTEYRLKEGKVVESYAHKLFPNAILIDHSRPFEDVIAQSNDAINRSSSPIFNAILNVQDLCAEVDILMPIEHEYYLYEIKSSTVAKPEYIPDIAFQKYVANKSGLRIRKCFLVLLNGSYLRNGEIEPNKLFKTGDVSEDVFNYKEIDAQVNNAMLTFQHACPDAKIGEQCTDDCPMRSICWSEVDAVPNNFFTLYHVQSKKAWGWLEQGIVKNADIPTPLSDRQKIQVKAEATGKIHVNKRAVKDFCNQLTCPLYFLDFETFSSPIPLIDNSSPYQAIPFQYSLHVVEKDLNEEPRHESWIWDIKEDPRKILLDKLKSLLGDTGSIIVYNATFEKMILKQAVHKFPEYEEWLTGILKRFVDLLMPFRNFSIYHPLQKGSCSLKATLPALTGRSYDGLLIGDGEQASREYLKIVRGEVKWTNKVAILRNLEIYCGQDSMAMIEILRKMKTML